MFRRTFAAFLLILAFGFVTVLGQPCDAATVWDEGVNGDLSGDRLIPTDLALALGSNTLTATSVSGDREYFTVTIPAGAQLSALVLEAYESLDALAFIGVQSGTALTEPPTGTNVANILGYTHFGTATLGSNILPNVGSGAGAIGFTPPLASGDYTFWSQQTGTNSATYRFNFQVVPEPTAIGTACLGGLIIGIAAMKRRLGRRPAGRQN